MSKSLLTSALILLITTSSFAKTGRDFKEQGSGISFTENKGQVHDQNYQPRPDILYGVMAGNMAVHIKNNGVSYQLNRVDVWKETENKLQHIKRKEADRQTIYRVDLMWLNRNANFTTTEDEALPGFNNYYLENCPSGALNVKSYKGITLNNLYKGINLHYYEKSGELKHDYIVAPYTDYRQIKILVKGAEVSVNKDGSLLLSTPLGKIQEGAPLVYQDSKQLKARWQINNNILGFEIENYDPSHELIIDPVTRLWGTYYGGNGNEGSYCCASDPANNVYIAGFTGTSAGTAIATAGSYQAYIGGSADGFLVKFNSSGVRQWGTYYGGSAFDYVNACHVDGAGNVYITGNAASSAAIATPGSHQSVFGGVEDAFLAKFNTNGVRVWATYYGGSGDDGGSCCVTDALGNVYMCGITTTSNNSSVIATPGSQQTTWGGGNASFYDAFLVKFNSFGVRQWGTYYGGNFDDKAESCAIDASGNVYMAGFAGSNTPNVIATVGSHQPVYDGNGDAFLVKFDPTGTRLWGTYYGGAAVDDARGCATDASGNVYLAGYTASGAGSGINTPGAHQPAHGGGTNDGYLVKFNGNGLRQWATYYGGTGEEDIFSCKTDATGNVYIAGLTSANTGTSIATASSPQPAYGGGASDAFLVKFNMAGARQWGTYYGGTADDDGFHCATDASGNVYLTGETNSSSGTSIATAGSYQPALQSLVDGFLAKFDACNAPAQPSAITGNTTVCTDSGVNTTYSVAAVPGATAYTWSLPADWAGSGNTNIISATPGTSGIFTLSATNNCGASPSQTLSVTVSECTGFMENGIVTAEIKLYPNPNNGTFNLELNSDNNVTVINAIGQLIYSSRLRAGHHQINLENCANGMYMMKIGAAANSKNIKLIKE